MQPEAITHHTFIQLLIQLSVERMLLLYHHPPLTVVTPLIQTQLQHCDLTGTHPALLMSHSLDTGGSMCHKESGLHINVTNNHSF